MSGACGGCGAQVEDGTALCGACRAARNVADTRATVPREPGARSTHLPIGDVVALRYRLDGVLGRGGHGVVFAATDLETGLEVALKVLHGSGERRRFVREAEALQRLSHPNVVRALDHGAEEGAEFLVLERVDGGSLADRIALGPMSWDVAARLVADAAAGLDHAHEAGVLHRDIKPSNVLITQGGTVKVTDFGIARLDDRTPLTESGTVLGTLAYIAPEVLCGREADECSDVHALGALLFELVAGRPPFVALTPEALTRLVVDIPAPGLHSIRADVPSAFADLVARCLAKDPVERPSRARQVEAELRRLLSRGLTDAPGAADFSPASLLASYPPPPEGERRRCAIVSLRWWARPGASGAGASQAAESAWENIRGEVLPVLAAHAARVVKVASDTLLIVIGVPHVTERDADRGLACAAELVHVVTEGATATGTVDAAAGVHVGHLLAEPGDAILALAAADAALVGSLAAGGAPSEVRVSQVASDALRGRAELVAIASSDADVSGEAVVLTYTTATRRTQARVRPRVLPLVGRAGEMALLTEAGTRALDGEGIAVTVSGAPGIGKTRLVGELLERLGSAHATARVAWVEAGPSGGRGSHEVFRVLLERLEALAGEDVLGGDRLAPPDRALLAALRTGNWQSDAVEHLVPADREAGLRAAWARLLAATCEEAPLVIVIEDLHWADTPSRELLGRVLEVVRSLRLLVVCTHRPEHQPAWAGRPFHRAVVLGPLFREEQRQLVREWSAGRDVPEAVMRVIEERSEGNPLFALEVARSLLAETHGPNGAHQEVDSGALREALPALPAGIEGIIAERCGRLSPQEARLLRAAAVLGRRFPAELLADVVGDAPARIEPGIEALVAADFLVERFSGPVRELSFRHALLQEVTHAGLAESRRRELHRRAAEAIARRHAAPLDTAAESLAHHHALSNEPWRALPFLNRTVERLLAAGDLTEGLRLGLEAVRLAELPRAVGVEPAERLRAVECASRALGQVGRGDEGVALARGALERVRQSGLRELESRARIVLAQAYSWSSNHADVLSLLEGVPALAREVGAADAWADALTLQAASLLGLGRSREAEAVVEALDARGFATTPQRLDGLRLRARLLFMRGDNQGALAAIQGGLDLSAAEGLRNRRLRFLAQAATVLSAEARTAESVAAAEECLAEARAMGALTTALFCLTLLAHDALQAGRLDRALSLAVDAESETRAVESKPYLAAALATQAQVWLARAQPWRALRLFEQVVDPKHGSALDPWRVRGALGLACVAVALGDDARAERELGLAAELADAIGDRFAACDAKRIGCSSQRLRSTGEALTGIEEESLELEQLARQLREPETACPALVERAECLRALGRSDAALAVALDAETAARASHRAVDACAAMVVRCGALADLGRTADAAAAAQEALGTARALGIPDLEWMTLEVLGRVAEASDRLVAVRWYQEAMLVLASLAGLLPVDRRATYLARRDRRELQSRLEGG